jgi:Bifunctional DNA primase/polymerase, N-terminal/Protein of unknown function (DUF3987)
VKTKSTAIGAAVRYIRKGWSVIPVPSQQKAPRLKGWQKLRISESELESYFDDDSNIGILLGEPSGNLTDVDLDCEHARSLAPYFLPSTDRIHGRRGSPSSHWYYVVDKPLKPVKFLGLKGESLVEIRSSGQQTICPPSRHPSGQRLRWGSKGAPARLAGRKLLRCVNKLAAATLLSVHWPQKGARNETGMALSGLLIRANWAEGDVEVFVSRVAWAAGDEEWRARKQAVKTTKRRLQKDDVATGGPRLRELLGSAVVDRLIQWLEIEALNGPTIDTVGTKTWPTPISRKGFYGLAGDIVRAIEPETEADPAALLVQLLAAAGNSIGRGPHFEVEGTRQSTNLFVLVVGRSSKARKGTAWAHIVSLFKRVDIRWTEQCLASNLSSGEGLVWPGRDQPNAEVGKSKDHRVHTEEIERDKRLLVVQSEFASALKIQRREGNILSAIIRQAWDGGKLRILTKNTPMEATAAHISVLGHITLDELVRELTATDEANGYANRFLFVCAQRSKLLPLGGRLNPQVLAKFVNRLQKAKFCARNTHNVGFTTKAEHLWRRVYPRLSADVPGMLGAITARAEAQVLRLSLIYALLDCSTVIKTQHLRAGLAVWKYCSHSARYIFGGTLGNRTADKILQALRKQKQMSRTEIREIFKRNLDSKTIQHALDHLSRYGLVISSTQATDGRPEEVWRAI